MCAGEIDLRGHGPRHRVASVAAQVPRVGELWSQAWAFGLFAVLYPVFFQVSTILLKYLGGDAQAGRWAIALAVMTAIYLIPATIYHKFLLSKLHRWAAHDQPKFWLVYRRGNVGMFLLGAHRGGIALVVVSPYAVPLLFGEAYRGVTAILMVLALCPPIRFLSTSMGAALLTDDHMRYRVYAMAWATLVAILLNAGLDSAVRGDRAPLGDGRRRNRAAAGHLARRAPLPTARGGRRAPCAVTIRSRPHGYQAPCRTCPTPTSPPGHISERRPRATRWGRRASTRSSSAGRCFRSTSTAATASWATRAPT